MNRPKFHINAGDGALCNSRSHIAAEVNVADCQTCVRRAMDMMDLIHAVSRGEAGKDEALAMLKRFGYTPTPRIVHTDGDYTVTVTAVESAPGGQQFDVLKDGERVSFTYSLDGAKKHIAVSKAGY